MLFTVLLKVQQHSRGRQSRLPANELYQRCLYCSSQMQQHCSLLAVQKQLAQCAQKFCNCMILCSSCPASTCSMCHALHRGSNRTTAAPYAGMSCQLTITIMKLARNGRQKKQKNDGVQQMPFRTMSLCGSRHTDVQQMCLLCWRVSLLQLYAMLPRIESSEYHSLPQLHAAAEPFNMVRCIQQQVDSTGAIPAEKGPKKPLERGRCNYN
jgi:hypothetical protein